MERDEATRPSDDDELATAVDEIDVDAVLDIVGFEGESTSLTRRQVEVLVLRERGFKQATIAERLGTSRANVSGIESSARKNVAKARETVRIADLLSAPVRVEIASGNDLYNVPYRVFDACDDANIKVNEDAPGLIRRVSDAAGDAVHGREVRERLVITVTADGDVWVNRP